MALSIRSSHAEDLQRLRSIYRRASLANEDDRQALLDNPQFLELPPTPVIEGRSRVAEEPMARSSASLLSKRPPRGPSSSTSLSILSRRMGVARALIDDAMSILYRQGILALEVTANPHALAFYEAAGFEITGSTTTPLGPGWRMRLTRTA